MSKSKKNKGKWSKKGQCTPTARIKGVNPGKLFVVKKHTSQISTSKDGKKEKGGKAKGGQ